METTGSSTTPKTPWYQKLNQLYSWLWKCLRMQWRQRQATWLLWLTPSPDLLSSTALRNAAAISSLLRKYKSNQFVEVLINGWFFVLTSWASWGDKLDRLLTHLSLVRERPYLQTQIINVHLIAIIPSTSWTCELSIERRNYKSNSLCCSCRSRDDIIQSASSCTPVLATWPIDCHLARRDCNVFHSLKLIARIRLIKYSLPLPEWIVVISPSSIPKLSFSTFAKGAKQLVVQEAFETIDIVEGS